MFLSMPIRWDVSPEIVQIGPFSLRWYGLLFALSFLIGLQLMRWIYGREKKPVADVEQLFIYVLIGTTVGARLGHCLFYDPVYYLSNPLEILKIWRGGLASHGAAVGILTALWLYARSRKGQPFLWVVDRVVITVALAGCFIRLGNLFNSEILGTATDLPWAFIFVSEDNVPRHPVQLYESIAYLLIFIGLFTYYRWLGGNIPHGLFLGLFLASIFGFRFFAEFVKERQAAYGMGFPLSVGQLLSIPAVAAGLWLIWRANKTGPPAASATPKPAARPASGKKRRA